MTPFVVICSRKNDISQQKQLARKCGYPYTVMKFKKKCQEVILRECLTRGLEEDCSSVIIMMNSTDITPARLKNIVDNNEYVSNIGDVICCTKYAATEILETDQIHELVDCGCKEILQSLPSQSTSGGISSIIYIGFIVFIILIVAWAALYIGPRG